MRLLAHMAGWCLLMAGLQLAVSEAQRTFWCDLPEWAGPGIYLINTPRPAPRRVVEVRPLGSLVADNPTGMDNQSQQDAGTQNSGRRGCG